MARYGFNKEYVLLDGASINSSTRTSNPVCVADAAYLGAFYSPTKEYRVCVQVKEGDDPAALGLETGTLPGGRYLRTRLRGEPPALYDRIAPTFEELLKQAPSDETRPSIEFYRRHDEIDLLLPVVDQ